MLLALRDHVRRQFIITDVVRRRTDLLHDLDRTLARMEWLIVNGGGLHSRVDLAAVYESPGVK